MATDNQNKPHNKTYNIATNPNTAPAPTQQTVFMISQLFAVLLAAASALAARNPVVVSPGNGTINAGDEILIQWANSTTGFVNIDLVNKFSEVLSAPVTIALGVPASQSSYKWKVPDFLRTAVGYELRVWGQTPPKPEDGPLGQSPLFTIFNNVPQAVNAFKVLKPSGKQTCAVGKPCLIEWAYPETADKGPAYVHIRLFQAGNPNPLYQIDDVPAIQKSYVWNVPNDAALINEGLYVSVSGAGTPPVGPGFSNEMGANGLTFGIAKELPAAPAAAAGDNAEFNEQAVFDTETATATSVTGTATVTSTATETNAAARMVSASSASSYALLLVIPMLVLLF